MPKLNMRDQITKLKADNTLLRNTLSEILYDHSRWGEMSAHTYREAQVLMTRLIGVGDES